MLGAALGITPTVGGSHPDHGTCNQLFSLGGAQYFEVLGPDPAATQEGPMAKRATKLRAPDIWTFAVTTKDLDALAVRARALGLSVQGPTPGSRRTPTGETLHWRYLYLISPEFKGLVPFAIDWLDTPHPSRTTVQGVRLQSMLVTHPRADALAALYAALGLEMTVHHGARSAIVVTLAHGSRVSTLIGSGDGIH